jgi:hypothetical protein
VEAKLVNQRVIVEAETWRLDECCRRLSNCGLCLQTRELSVGASGGVMVEDSAGSSPLADAIHSLREV